MSASSRYSLFAAFPLCIACIAGCAPLPPTQDARGLYVDLEKAVDFQESRGWVVDRLASAELHDGIMGSVCQASPEAQEDLLSWINARFESEIGPGASDHTHPSAILYEQEGRLTGRVKQLRRLERVRLLLEAGQATFDECPYWAEVDTDFAGVESDEARFVLFLESAGAGGIRFASGNTGFGGGGSGRLMLGYGIRRFTLALGVELGADGSLPETESGGRSFEAVFSSAVPVLLRYTQVNRVVDLEVSYRTLWADNTRHGVRFGIGYGITTPRISGLLPYGALWIGYELFPAMNGAPTEHALLLGTRVGFDWDP